MAPALNPIDLMDSIRHECHGPPYCSCQISMNPQSAKGVCELSGAEKEATMVSSATLAMIPAQGNLLSILLHEGLRCGLPYIHHIAQDPTGTVSRIGDALVWNGASGQQTLAGLASLSEGQLRIEQVVNHIDSVQLGTSHTLGVMHTLSIATLGITSLSGAYMVWRFQSLNKRFDKLSQTLQDVEDNVAAANKAHLDVAVQKLNEFDESADETALKKGRDEAQEAAAIYGDMSWREASKKRLRIEILNYRSRCYLLGLMAELHCRILLNDLPAAIKRANTERHRLQSLARVTFEEVIRGKPERYLRADLASEGVTLDLMAELYQQARHAGAIAIPEIESASHLFEHCRARGILGSSKLFGGNSKHDAIQLRYLMACLEEINRIEGMRLLMAEANEKKASISALRESIREWWKVKVGTTIDATGSVVAYSLA
jgi:hypothetical protein